RNARLPLNDELLELVACSRSCGAQLRNGLVRPRAETCERPEREVLGHVLRVGPDDPEHRRRLEDRVVCRASVVPQLARRYSHRVRRSQSVALSAAPPTMRRLMRYSAKSSAAARPRAPYVPCLLRAQGAMR